MLDTLKKTVFSAIDTYASEVFALNDDIADHPEISAQEFETSKKIVSFMRKHGFDVTAPYAGLETAFIAKTGDGSYKRNIALLAEYDALPAIGHACGHCASGSLSILAAIALSSVQKELGANVHLIGTPDEERAGAKCKMANDGVFDGYDIAAMIHMSSKNMVTSKFLALDSFRYTFHGQPSHASASPWEGRNALNGVTLMMHAMDMLRQHVRPDVRMHGYIDYGGEAANIVPAKASAEIYVRAEERAYLDEIVRKVDDCAKGAAIATQTTFDREPTAYPYDNLKNNATGERILTEGFESLGLPVYLHNAALGSSDAGNVSMRCPMFHPSISICEEMVPTHTVEFANLMKTEATHRAIVNGAKLLSIMMLRLFTDEKELAALKADFAAK